MWNDYLNGRVAIQVEFILLGVGELFVDHSARLDVKIDVFASGILGLHLNSVNWGFYSKYFPQTGSAKRRMLCIWREFYKIIQINPIWKNPPFAWPKLSICIQGHHNASGHGESRESERKWRHFWFFLKFWLTSYCSEVEYCPSDCPLRKRTRRLGGLPRAMSYRFTHLSVIIASVLNFSSRRGSS